MHSKKAPISANRVRLMAGGVAVGFADGLLDTARIKVLGLSKAVRATVWRASAALRVRHYGIFIGGLLSCKRTASHRGRVILFEPRRWQRPLLLMKCDRILC